MSLTKIRLLLIFCALATAGVCQADTDIDLSFELTDEMGSTVTADDFSGQLQLVFFGFTSCPDICPITLANISTALKSLGEQSQDVSVLFISIDPKRDTPERLRAYTEAFHPSIVGLTGSYQQIAAITSD